MPSDFIVGGGGPGPKPVGSGQVDWARLKEDVVARLDMKTEFEALGVRFTGCLIGGYKLECHAINREDVSPSAFVNVNTGVYSDRGGNGESLHLFTFAATHGSFGDWSTAMRHYAEKAGVPVGKLERKSRGRIFECSYDYHDEEGRILYRIFRYILPTGKKDFSQCPPDGRGGWKFGAGAMEGVRIVPYRLPDLLGSDTDDPIFITEGEKAAEAVAALGLTVTTWPGGSSATKVFPGIVPHFKGRDCYVLADNDKGGRKAGDKLCELLSPLARVAKLVFLPDLPPKGDAVEWIADGGTAEALGKLCHEAPAWTPGILEASEAAAPESDDPAARICTLADLRATLSGTAWLWPQWIASSALTLLAAQAGTGKTRFLFDLHRRLYHGLPMPDGYLLPDPLDRPKVLWVAADGQYQELADIATEFGLPDDSIVLSTSAADPYAGTQLQTAEDLANFERWIVVSRPAFVAIDTITNTANFKIQDAADAKSQYKPLQDIATRNHIPIIVVSHLNANKEALGRRVTEKVRVVMQLSRPDKEGQPLRRALWVEKSKALIPPPLGVTMGTVGNEYDFNPPKEPEEGKSGSRKGPEPAKLRECKAWLAAYMKDDIHRLGPLRAAWEAAGYSTGIAYRAKEELGIIESESETGRGKRWQMPVDPSTINFGEVG